MAPTTAFNQNTENFFPRHNLVIFDGIRRTSAILIVAAALWLPHGAGASEQQSVSRLWVSCAPMMSEAMHADCERYIGAVIASPELRNRGKMELCLTPTNAGALNGVPERRRLRKMVYSYLEREKESELGFLHITTAEDAVLQALESGFPC